MTAPRDGGPAWPNSARDDGVEVRFPGSLLDYFAGQALSSADLSLSWDGEPAIARYCYSIAAAMLRERERRQREDTP